MPKLPTWTDPGAVATYLTSLASVILGIVVMVHPGFREPVLVQTWIPVASYVIAGVAQLVNVITHRSANTKAWIAAHAAPVPPIIP